MNLIFKFIPATAFWAVFIFVVLQIPYPESLTQANITQLLSFFIPLFLAIALTFNIFLKNIFVAVSISLGIISLLILKALDSLNLVTAVLVVFSIGLLISYFRKFKRHHLTKLPKIPKLTNLRRKKYA